MTSAGQHEGRSDLLRGLAPLAIRNYALYWVGFVTSNTGRWIELTGTLWLAYQLTGSAVLLGLIGLARALPALVLSPIAGVVADRVDQRRFLFATQGVALVGSLTIGLLTLTGNIQLWHVYLQVTLGAAVGSFDAAVRQALFPRLVPRSRLPEAVTLTVTAGRSSRLIGPAVGGLAIATWGEAAPFLLNAATFLILMGAVVLMRGVTRRVARAGASFRLELVEGLRHIAHAPVLSGLLKIEIVFGVFQMNEVMITIISREVLGVGPEGLGLLLSAPALGSLIGVAGLVALGQPARQGRFAVVCMFAYTGALAAVAVAPIYVLTFAALCVTGFLDALVTVTRHSMMQLAAPGRMRGRVMANMATITNGVGPLAQTQSGVLAATVGPRAAIVVAAVALLIAGGATARTNPALWTFSRDDIGSPTDGRGSEKPRL